MEPEDNQAPAAPPAPDQGKQDQPSDKPAGKPASRQPQGKLTREQRATLADKISGKRDDDPEPAAKPAAKAEAKPKAEPEPKSDTKEKPEPEKPEPKAEGAPDDKAKSELADLLKAGQLEELAEKLGVDRKSVDVSNAKLRLARGRAQEAEAKLRAADAKIAEAKELREAAKKEFGAPHKAREAYDKGDFAGAAQWIANALDDDFASITRNVANATKGMDEKTLATFRKERELNQREAALNAKERDRERTVTEEQRIAKGLKTIEAKCAGHDVLKLKGASRAIHKRLEEAWDAKSGELKLGYKQAADQVLAEFMQDAEALGLTKAEPAPKVESTPPPKSRSREEFPARQERVEDDGTKTRGLSFAERQARAARAYERSRV